MLSTLVCLFSGTSSGAGLREHLEFGLEGGEWWLLDAEDDTKSQCSVGCGKGSLPRPDEMVGD